MYWKSLSFYLLLNYLLLTTLFAQAPYNVYAKKPSTKENYDTSTYLPLVDGRQFHYQKLDKVPLAYPYLRAADVLWSKRIWRAIPVAQKGDTEKH